MAIEEQSLDADFESWTQRIQESSDILEILEPLRVFLGQLDAMPKLTKMRQASLGVRGYIFGVKDLANTLEERRKRLIEVVIRRIAKDDKLNPWFKLLPNFAVIIESLDVILSQTKKRVLEDEKRLLMNFELQDRLMLLSASIKLSLGVYRGGEVSAESHQLEAICISIEKQLKLWEERMLAGKITPEYEAPEFEQIRQLAKNGSEILTLQMNDRLSTLLPEITDQQTYIKRLPAIINGETEYQTTLLGHLGRAGSFLSRYMGGE